MISIHSSAIHRVMVSIPEMIMIGGNSRNSGKTTLACEIISKLSVNQDIIGLKVTNVHPGDEEKHGDHSNEISTEYRIYEELDRESQKDTSKMLKAGAAHVFYIRVADSYMEQAILDFLAKFANKQVIVCESRSLRKFIEPGLFLMMIRKQEISNEKDVSAYLSKADRIFYLEDDINEKRQFAESLFFKNGEFVLTR